MNWAGWYNSLVKQTSIYIYTFIQIDFRIQVFNVQMILKEPFQTNFKKLIKIMPLVMMDRFGAYNTKPQLAVVISGQQAHAIKKPMRQHHILRSRHDNQL